MKTTKLLFSLLSLSLIYACGSDDDDKSPIDKLTGGSQKAWKVNSSSENGVDKCIGDCVKDNYTFIFKRSGTVTFSTYSCSNEPCNSGTSSQTGGEIPYTISDDGKTLNVNSKNPTTILKLTETEFSFEEILGTHRIVTTFIPK